MFKRGNSKGAIELSISTLVVIVLAMAMLILGLVLVRSIFTNATDATELVNDNVKAQINKLFNDQDTKTIVYLPNNEAEVNKGNSYNVRFAMRNTARGAESQAGSFTYAISASEVEQGCRLTLQQADKYIKLGKAGGPISILPGDEPKERVIVIEPDENAPLCSINYDIVTKKDGQIYDTNFFIVRIVA